jgi:hypothetical protein
MCKSNEKTPFSVNVGDIQSIRITCKHCKTAVILPLSVGNVPHQCINCATTLPASTIKEIMQQLGFLSRQLRENKAEVTFMLHLEGE